MNSLRAQQNDTLDAISWRHYGRSVVEQLMAANPQLADLPPILPIGTLVYLPDIPDPQQIRQTIQLWD